MGPAALARAPRLRSVPMTVPFCPGEPKGRCLSVSPRSLRPGEPQGRLKALTIAGDHGGQARHHDSSSWGNIGR
jgi:hypothetical protein